MELIDFILHIDEHLQSLINSVGPMIYAVLFGIIFAETGFVVTLPARRLTAVCGRCSGGRRPVGRANYYTYAVGSGNHR